MAAARVTTLAETEREIAFFGRRAKSPAAKVAYAELQQELQEVRERWEMRGLLAEAEPEIEAAA